MGLTVILLSILGLVAYVGTRKKKVHTKSGPRDLTVSNDDLEAKLRKLAAECTDGSVVVLEPKRRAASPRRTPQKAPMKLQTNSDWTTLPKLPAKVVAVPEMWYRPEPTLSIDLGNMTCPCERWVKDEKHMVPLDSVGRCCTHLAKAAVLELESMPGANPWLLRILRCCEEYGPPAHFEVAKFSNGMDDFVALYDLKRGYVQLYGPSKQPVQWGYDSSQNRWSYGEGPEPPLAIKHDLRPWIKAMDLRHGNSPKT